MALFLVERLALVASLVVLLLGVADCAPKYPRKQRPMTPEFYEFEYIEGEAEAPEECNSCVEVKGMTSPGKWITIMEPTLMMEKHMVHTAYVNAPVGGLIVLEKRNPDSVETAWGTIGQAHSPGSDKMMEFSVCDSGGILETYESGSFFRMRFFMDPMAAPQPFAVYYEGPEVLSRCGPE